MGLKGAGYDGMDWTELAQDRLCWKVMNFRDPWKRGISWPSEELSASQGLCSMEFYSWSVNIPYFSTVLILSPPWGGRGPSRTVEPRKKNLSFHFYHRNSAQDNHVVLMKGNVTCIAYIQYTEMKAILKERIWEISYVYSICPVLFCDVNGNHSGSDLCVHEQSEIMAAVTGTCRD
jgi:hypothetical protein